MDGLVNAFNLAQPQQLMFPSATNVAGGWVNLNQAGVNSFGQMAAPTAFGSGGTAYTRTAQTTGFPRFNNPTGSNTPYIGKMGFNMANAGTMHIYDLVWAASGFAGNVATAQSVVGGAALPTRASTGRKLEIWIGCSSAIGATASNVTVQYTNTASTAGRNTTSVAIIASMPANRMQQLSLQTGDDGVLSVQSLTLSISTGTAGNLWVMLMQRIASIGCPLANVNYDQDFATLGLPAISAETTPLFVHQATTTSSGIIMGMLTPIEG